MFIFIIKILRLLFKYTSKVTSCENLLKVDAIRFVPFKKLAKKCIILWNYVNNNNMNRRSNLFYKKAD